MNNQNSNSATRVDSKLHVHSLTNVHGNLSTIQTFAYCPCLIIWMVIKNYMYMVSLMYGIIHRTPMNVIEQFACILSLNLD